MFCTRKDPPSILEDLTEGALDYEAGGIDGEGKP